MANVIIGNREKSVNDNRGICIYLFAKNQEISFGECASRKQREKKFDDNANE